MCVGYTCATATAIELAEFDELIAIFFFHLTLTVCTPELVSDGKTEAPMGVTICASFSSY